MRINPTLNEYQSKIVKGLSFSMGVEPATITKQALYEMIRSKPQHELDRLIQLSEEYDKENKK